MTNEQKSEFIQSSNFAYARYKTHKEAWAIKEWGAGYYQIYKKDQSSPTGVSSYTSCTITEWEELSKLAGKSHQYLAPAEKF